VWRIVVRGCGASLSREELRVLAEEQTALRRVATLVGRGVPPDEVFAAVTEEVGRLLCAEYAGLGRYESDGTVTIVAGSGRRGDEIPVGRAWSLGGKNINTLVFETGRPARIDDYADASGTLGVTAREHGVGSAVGTPVIVEGRLWGVMAIYSTPDQPLSADTEARLADFTELVVTAIANAESRAELARLVEEQAALRRIATLVARGVPPEEVFATVTDEVGRLLGTALAGMARYDSDDTVTVVATWAAEDGHGGAHPLVPGPWPLEGGDLASTISRTGRPVRIDTYDGVPGRIATFVRDELGIGSSVGSPIVVEGLLWGALFVHAKQTHQPLPRDTESRLTDFTELVAAAIANAESRAALAASRARIVAAADETRRRIERDLHDGTQQRLVSLGLDLRAAQAAVPPHLGELEHELARVGDGLASVLDELREIARGIHPAILSEGGLEPALKALCRRSAVPVELDVHAERRLPKPVEVAAYYVVSEALTNTAKHAHASAVHVELDTHQAILRLAIRDNGIGGADPGQGSGLVGLSDRIEALGGTLQVTSPAGSGTTLRIEVPVEGQRSGAV
jgi:signal transduction histidine kinase